MSQVAAQTRDSRAWERLKTYPVPVAIVRVETVAALAALVREPSVLGLVVDVLDGAGQPTAPAVRSIRQAHPDIPIVLWCSRSDAGSTVSREVLGAGADGLWVQDPTPLERRLFGQLVPRGELRYHEWIEASIERVVPPEARAIVATCLHPANPPMTVPKVAQRFGLARRTLTDRLAQVGLPTGRELIEWGSLLAAAWDLEHSRLSVERIAHDHGFSSASALRAALKRLTLQGPATLRTEGSFGWVLRCFERRVRVTRRPAES